MSAILKTIWPYLLAFFLGAAVGGGIAYSIEHAKLANEQAAHAKDMKAVSDAAIAAQQKSIEDHQQAAQQIAALDTKLTQEKTENEKLNEANRAAIANGSRELRVAVSNYTGSGDNGQGTGTGGLGNGATGFAVLAPEVGLDLYSIADGADNERSQLIYLQGYVETLQKQGYIEGGGKP